MRRPIVALVVLSLLSTLACVPTFNPPGARLGAVQHDEGSREKVSSPGQTLSPSASDRDSDLRKLASVPIAMPTGPRASATIRSIIRQSSPSASDRIGSFSFVDAMRGWSAAGHVILTTEDGGAHWTRSATVDSAVNDLRFLSGQQGWAATQGGLLKTVDGGRTWQKLDVPGGPITRVEFVDPSRGWVSVGDYKYPGKPVYLRTVDGGKSWFPVANPCADKWDAGLFTFTAPQIGWLLCSGQATTQMQPRVLFKTQDGGQSWGRIAHASVSSDGPTGLPDTLPVMGHVTELFFLDHSNGWLAESHGGLFATRDGGLSWGPVSVSRSPEAEQSFLGVQFVSREQGFITTQRDGIVALLTTRDGGASWSQQYPPLAPLGRVQFFGPHVGIGLTSVLDRSAVLRTTDGGCSWAQVGSVAPDLIRSVSFLDSEHGWAIVQGFDRLSSTIVSNLFRSTDGGGTWKKLAPEARRPKDLYAGLSFIDARTGYIWTGWGHLYMTQDGGDTLRAVDASDTRSQFFQFLSADVGWKIDDFQIYATADGGRSWSLIPLGYRVMELQLQSPGRAWVGALDCSSGSCQHLTLLTADGGETWTRYDLGPLGGGMPVFADDQHGWLSSPQGRQFITADGGRTWADMP